MSIPFLPLHSLFPTISRSKNMNTRFCALLLSAILPHTPLDDDLHLHVFIHSFTQFNFIHFKNSAFPSTPFCGRFAIFLMPKEQQIFVLSAISNFFLVKYYYYIIVVVVASHSHISCLHLHITCKIFPSIEMPGIDSFISKYV